MGIEYNMDTAHHSIPEETNELKPAIQSWTPAEVVESENKTILPAGADFLLCYASAEGKFFLLDFR